MAGNLVVVLTARGPQRILDEGGSQAWRLDQRRARDAEYLVCVQNRNNGDWGGATEPHSTAFLIGRIKEIVPSPERPSRWLIKISEYARIKIPNVWQAWRYPVRYMSLKELDIDLTTLRFEPVPVPPSGGRSLPLQITADQVSGIKLGEVIAAAKRQIAQVAGVPAESVRISVDLA